MCLPSLLNDFFVPSFVVPLEIRVCQKLFDNGSLPLFFGYSAVIEICWAILHFPNLSTRHFWFVGQWIQWLEPSGMLTSCHVVGSRIHRHRDLVVWGMTMDSHLEGFVQSMVKFLCGLFCSHTQRNVKLWECAKCHRWESVLGCGFLLSTIILIITLSLGGG